MKIFEKIKNSVDEEQIILAPEEKLKATIGLVIEAKLNFLINAIVEFNREYEFNDRGQVVIKSIHQKPLNIVNRVLDLVETHSEIRIDSFIAESEWIFCLGKMAGFLDARGGECRRNYEALLGYFQNFLPEVYRLLQYPESAKSLNEEIFGVVESGVLSNQSSIKIYDEKTGAFNPIADRESISNLAIDVIRQYAKDEVRRVCSAKANELSVKVIAENLEIERSRIEQLKEKNDRIAELESQNMVLREMAAAARIDDIIAAKEAEMRAMFAAEEVRMRERLAIEEAQMRARLMAEFGRGRSSEEPDSNTATIRLHDAEISITTPAEDVEMPSAAVAGAAAVSVANVSAVNHLRKRANTI